MATVSPTKACKRILLGIRDRGLENPDLNTYYAQVCVSDLLNRPATK